MCQISAVLEEDGREEILMEGVTGLEVTPDGILLTTFFEEPRKVEGVEIQRIDFLGGRLVLARGPAQEEEEDKGDGPDE